MNKRLQHILTELLGTGTTVAGRPPSTVQVHKTDRLKLEAMNQLVALACVVQVGTRCDGDVLVFGSAYAHFFGEGGDANREAARKANGLD